MGFLAHRGLWHTCEEQNTPEALLRALRAGFGVELDVRDDRGRLVIAHDPLGPRANPAEFLPWIQGIPPEILTLPLAVNIKCDGIEKGIKSAFSERSQLNAFVFDASVPELIRYARNAIPFFTRHSDYEPEPVLYEEALGVWLDAFSVDWFGARVISRHLSNGKTVALVSPELHGREPVPVWRKWKSELSAEELEQVWICTDLPNQARDFFYK